MKKVWLVIKHEYLRHVLRKRFIVSVLSIPFFILIMVGIAMITVLVMNDWRPVGYVDRSGVLAGAQPLPEQKERRSRSVEIQPFESEDAVLQAVENGEIQAAFILAADYRETGAVSVIVDEDLSDNARQDFRQFLVRNLLKDQPAGIQERILEGPSLVFRSLTDSREFAENNILGLIVPLVAGVMLIVAINVSGGYLLQAVTEEKENRTIEMVVTSISPAQLMAGKIFGNLSVGLTQLIIWALTGAGGVALVMRAFPEISGSGLDLSFLGLMLITFLPAFVMIAALMAMVGATAAEARDAQQIAGLFSIPVVFPMWFLAVIIEKPNSPLAVIMSIVPFTAPLTLPMRSVLTTVPTWQIALTIGLLVASAAASVWLASRAFRLGLLRYGKSLSLREILSRAK